MEIGQLLYPEAVQRPRKRSECIDGIRPCPYVGCRYHLYTDVSHTGGLKINFPDVEPWDLTWSCALDIADAADLAQQNVTLESVGRVLNITRERVRQVESRALARANARLRELLEDPEWFDEFESGTREEPAHTGPLQSQARSAACPASSLKQEAAPQHARGDGPEAQREGVQPPGRRAGGDGEGAKQRA